MLGKYNQYHTLEADDPAYLCPPFQFCQRSDRNLQASNKTQVFNPVQIMIAEKEFKLFVEVVVIPDIPCQFDVSGPVYTTESEGIGSGLLNC